MLYLIIILSLIAIVVGCISANRKSHNSSIDADRAQFDGTATNKSTVDNYYIGQKVIGLSARKGYNKYPIAGAYYQNLSIDMVGKFNGYAIAQTDNEYDLFAIAIFNDAGIHLGFLPKKNKTLHHYILQEGGKVHAYGYLGWNGGIYGEVCVETNKELVTKRNKPYQVD